jgi:hypothetical protein
MKRACFIVFALSCCMGAATAEGTALKSCSKISVGISAEAAMPFVAMTAPAAGELNGVYYPFLGPRLGFDFEVDFAAWAGFAIEFALFFAIPPLELSFPGD